MIPLLFFIIFYLRLQYTQSKYGCQWGILLLSFPTFTTWSILIQFPVQAATVPTTGRVGGQSLQGYTEERITKTMLPNPA